MGADESGQDTASSNADVSPLAPFDSLADRFDASRHVLRSMTDDGVMVVTVSGALGSITDGVMRSVILGGSATRVHLDLSGVSFIGCSTVTVLLQVEAELSRRDQSLAICSASDRVQRVLGLAGLTDLLTPSAPDGHQVHRKASD